MRARRRRAGCGGGPKGRAGRRRRFNSVEPRALPAPWPGPLAARGGAAGGRRGPAAAASSCGNSGPSAAAAATPPARGEWSCCSSAEQWEPFPCAACCRHRRRPSGRRGEARRTAAAAAFSAPRAQRRPQRPRPAAHRWAEVGRAGEEIRGGRALRRETDPRRQLGCHASLGLKKKTNPTKKELPSTASSRPFFILLRLLSPPPSSAIFFSPWV